MAYPSKPADSLFDYVTSKLGDVAVTGAKGVVGLGQAAIGLADIPTGGAVGRFIEQQTPIDLQAAQEYLGQQYTPDVQQGMQEISNAQGFLGTVGAAIQNPEATAHIVGESLVGTKGAALFGRGVGRLATKTAGKMEGGLAKKVLDRFGASGISQAALGEGAMMAGIGAENIRYQTPERDLSPEQALIAGGIGVAGGALGVLGGKAAEKLGVIDPDVLMVGAATQPAQKGLLKNIAGTALSEGVFEEMPQSAMETMAQNVALDKPVMEGVEESAGMGLVAGAAMGGGMAAITTPFQNKMIALENAKKEALDEVVAEHRAAAENITAAKSEDIALGTQSTSLMPNAPTLEESQRLQQDAIKANVLTEDTAQEISGVDTAAQVAEEEAENELPEVVRAAATQHGVKPKVFHQTVETIYKAAKNFKDFSVNLVKQFGETIKKYALQLYQTFKKSILEAQPGLSTQIVGDEAIANIRPTYERLQAEQDERQKIIKDAAYREEVAAAKGITPQALMQQSVQAFNNNLKNLNRLKAQVNSPSFIQAERKAQERAATAPVQEVAATIQAQPVTQKRIPVLTEIQRKKYLETPAALKTFAKQHNLSEEEAVSVLSSPSVAQAPVAPVAVPAAAPIAAPAPVPVAQPVATEPVVDEYAGLTPAQAQTKRLADLKEIRASKLKDREIKLIPERQGRQLRRVISGGQSGVDITALALAKELGLLTGGTAGANFTVFDDQGNKIKRPELKELYGMVPGKWTKKKGKDKEGKETEYYDPFHQRTIANAQAADATIWFGQESPGYIATTSKAAQKGKPAPLINPGMTEEQRKKRMEELVARGIQPKVAAETVEREDVELAIKQTRDYLKANRVQTVNIAGNRFHTNSAASVRAAAVLKKALLPEKRTAQESRAERAVLARGFYQPVTKRDSADIVNLSDVTPKDNKIPVKKVPDLKSREGTQLHIRTVNGTIEYNEAGMRSVYENARWSKPRILTDGTRATPLPENIFQSYDEFVRFMFEHEAAHIVYKQKEGETRGAYETRMNSIALEAILTRKEREALYNLKREVDPKYLTEDERMAAHRKRMREYLIVYRTGQEGITEGDYYHYETRLEPMETTADFADVLGLEEDEKVPDSIEDYLASLQEPVSDEQQEALDQLDEQLTSLFMHTQEEEAVIQEVGEAAKGEQWLADNQELIVEELVERAEEKKYYSVYSDAFFESVYQAVQNNEELFLSADEHAAINQRLADDTFFKNISAREAQSFIEKFLRNVTVDGQEKATEEEIRFIYTGTRKGGTEGKGISEVQKKIDKRVGRNLDIYRKALAREARKENAKSAPEQRQDEYYLFWNRMVAENAEYAAKAKLIDSNLEAFYTAVLDMTSAKRETAENVLTATAVLDNMKGTEEFNKIPYEDRMALVEQMIRLTYLNVNTEYRTYKAQFDDEFSFAAEEVERQAQIDAYHAAPEPIQPLEVRTTDATGRPLRGTVKTLAIKEDETGRDIIRTVKYREWVTDVKNYLMLALEKEFIDEQQYDALLVELEKVINRENTTKEDIAFYRSLIGIKTKLAQDSHKRQAPIDPNVFEQMAKDNADLGLTPADLYQEYLNMGSEMFRMTRRIQEIREIKLFQEKQEKLKEIGRARTTEEKAQKIREFVTTNLTEEAQARYQAYLKHDEDTRFETIERKLFAALENAEINLAMQEVRLALKNNKSIHSESPATSKAHNFVMPDLSDFYQNKSYNRITDFERDLLAKDARVKSVGRLSNPIVHAFYRLVAKTFGADLVIVVAENYNSRYIGEASDGRSKIVINVAGSSDEASFHHVFAHELFHHVVNKVNPKAYDAFRNEVISNIATHEYNLLLQRKKNQGVQNAEEEVLAELFASVMFNKQFYFDLASTFHGKSIAGTLVVRLLNNVDKLLKVLSSPSNPGFSYENQLIIENSKMEQMHDLFLSLVGSAYQSHQHSFKVNHKGIRFFTPQEAVNELKGYAETPKKWIQGQWQSVAPDGTKNKEGIMNAIENIIGKLLQWVKDNVTNSMFAHFMVDPRQMKLVHKIAYEKNFARAKANALVVQKHPEAFRGMTEEQLRVMHDHFVRGIQTVKFFNPVTKKEEDRIEQIDPLDVGTTSAPNAEGVKRALSLGYSQEIIETFQGYKEITDKIYARLLKIYPELGENPTHYGQSIRWLRENVLLDPDFDWAISPERSVLEGNKRYLKEKSMNKRTIDIETQYNAKPATMNPHEMFLDYVADTNQLISLHNAINEGLVTRDKHGLPIARIFKSRDDAAIHGYVPVDDNGLKTFGKMDLKTGFNVVVDGEIYEEEGQPQVYSTLEEAEIATKRIVSSWAKRGVEVTASPVEVKNATVKQTSHYTIKAINKKDGTSGLANEYTFREKEKADQYVARLNRANKDPNITYETHAVLGAAQTPGVVSQVYFLKDTAKLLNLLMARDPLRNGRWLGMSGRTIMNAKNMQTSVEFAFSLFHAMTITQEVIASYTSWYQLKNKDRKGIINRTVSSYNPRKMVMETREIAAILEASLSDPEVANHPQTQKRLAELLQVDEVDALDLIKQYYMVGGLLGQDSSLRSHLHDLGPGMKYVKNADMVKIINGEPVFLPNEFLKSLVFETPGEMLKSVGEVYKDSVGREPNKKLKASIQTALFAGLQAPTAFLMEYGIPRVKLATFAREYTLGLERNRAKINAGNVLKEQVAHETILFIEDRFGEVNWQNNWLKPWMKTALQFMFRSFTWFTGSWKAFAKAGIDVGKWGWFKVKGEEYEITEKGLWAMNAMISHMLMAGLVTTGYMIAVGASGGGEVPEDEETPWPTKLLFPRVDRFDPEARVTIPSYITEGYKIMRHLAIIGHEFEPSKMITGRFNSFIGRGYEALWAGEDWRGVSIVNRDDNVAEKAFKKIWHVAAVPPISFSSAAGTFGGKGLHAWRQMSLAGLGFTDAPAAAKRPEYENVAFDIRQKAFRGREQEVEEMEEKDELRRAMYAYQRGDKTHIDQLLNEGRVSPRQYQLALSKIPTINGEPNPKYKTRYQQALKNLTIDDALETWDVMPETARAKYRKDIIKKYSNMMAKKDKPAEYKKKIREQMFELGILQ